MCWRSGETVLKGLATNAQPNRRKQWCARGVEMAPLGTAAWLSGGRHPAVHPHLPVQVALGCNRVLQPLKMHDSPLQAQERGLVRPPFVHSSGTCPHTGIHRCAACLQVRALPQAKPRGKAAHQVHGLPQLPTLRRRPSLATS